MLMTPIPTTLPSLSHPTLTASCRVPGNQLTEEEKTQAWFTHGSAPSKHLQHYSLFLGHP